MSTDRLWVHMQIKHVCHWHRWNGAGRQISIVETVKSWHLTSHTAVFGKLVMNTWAVTKRSTDGCQNICPTNRSLTEWPPHWPHSTVKELKVMICHQWLDIGASLQPGGENGIHGIEAFHITCKEGVFDSYECREGKRHLSLLNPVLIPYSFQICVTDIIPFLSFFI